VPITDPCRSHGRVIHDFRTCPALPWSFVLFILLGNNRCPTAQLRPSNAYSITSSARRRVEVGNETPIALAVRRFTVNS
jgi:hypothetical protein